MLGCQCVLIAGRPRAGMALWVLAALLWFALGMYAVGTFKLIEALGLDFLPWLPPVFGVAAGLAWAAAFGGLLQRLAGMVARQARPGS